MSSDADVGTATRVSDQKADQLRRLTEISRALTYATSLDQVTRLTVDRSAELLDATVAVLMLRGSDDLMHVRAAIGIGEERVARFRAPLDDELMDRMQGLLAVPPDFFIAVPLVAGGELTGLVAVALTHASTAADEWLLSALADQAAVALENARQGGEVRAEMEARLVASEGATTAKDQALATLAHDIRTPLGAIDGYCSILEEEMQGPINDRQRETLGRVRMAGRHLLSLLDNVMEMARLTAGVVHVEAEDVRLADVARDAVHMLTPASDSKLQTLVIKVVADAVVTADSARLRQILINLIGNAVKFTQVDGNISVTIDQTLDSVRARGTIQVTDDGPGIRESERAAIFAPYYRSEATAQTAGVGLGLAISRALIERMAGELELRSDSGKGATFIIGLPLAATQI